MDLSHLLLIYFQTILSRGSLSDLDMHTPAHRAWQEVTLQNVYPQRLEMKVGGKGVGSFPPSLPHSHVQTTHFLSVCPDLQP